jgi:DNA polymerase-3 subunit gamma/tau
MALALARKYRPRSFAEVAVQRHVSNTLKGAIARDRVAHGYLFCGPRGTGKTTLARVLAMALNCEHKQADGEPDGTCSSCQRIWSGASSLDVVEIDAASNRGVDDARELRERAMYAPSGDDRYKVYIVDEAHMLTREAWNALLKVLEEPPPRVVFVFATTEPQKIAQTAAPVLSRLQRFDLKRIGPADVIARLTEILAKEEIPAEPEALVMIARAADGSMRDALSLTDQVISLGEGHVTPLAVRDALGLVPEDEFLAILDLIAAHRAGDVFDTVQRLADAGIDFGTFLSGLADLLRAQLAVVLGGHASDVSAQTLERLRANAEQFPAGDLLRMLNALSELEPRFRKSGQQQLLVELLLVRFALFDRTLSIDDVLRTLGEGGGGNAGGSSSGGASDWRAALANAGGEPTPREAGSREMGSRDVGSRPSAATSAMRSAAAAVSTPSVSSSAPSSPPPSSSASSAAAAVRNAERNAHDTSSAPHSPAVAAMKRAMEAATTNGPVRLTDEQIKAERVEKMREKDPVLGAAIDALDLELLD